MKPIIFGGSFDPVHIGHLFLAVQIRYYYPDHPLILVPNHISPHKKQVSAGFHRLAMLDLALEGQDFQYDSCELERKGLSYSIDTIETIVEKYQLKEKPYLLIGNDLLESFPSWKDADRILSQADILVANRKENIAVPKQQEHFYFLSLPCKCLPISSTEIRQRVQQHLPIDYLVPLRVNSYIREHKLYV